MSMSGSRLRLISIAAALLLIPVLAAAGENPAAGAPPAPAAPDAPLVAPGAAMTPALPEPVPPPLFLSTYFCTHSVDNCGTTWSCGKTCQVGQDCGCIFQFGQTPEGACIIRVVGAYCI